MFFFAVYFYKHKFTPIKERWPSGRRRTPGKCVNAKSVSRVRIPSSLLLKNKQLFIYLTPIKTSTNLRQTTMKRLFSILTIAGLFFASTSMSANSVFEYGSTTSALFQEDQDDQEVADERDEAETESDTTAVEEADAAVEEVEEVAQVAEVEEEESLGFHQELKKRFIEGGPGFMGIVLLCLILGLAIAIERIIYLNLASTNTKKLTTKVEDALNSGGVEAAKEVCRNTSGPVASIYYQGLDRMDEGVDAAEKAVVAYGGVQMGQMEKNVSWVSLFIALAPMLGFMGTVIGMIKAFDKIEAAGDMQPSLVAGGIKVALLTTVFGLIVAIILQIFYNYIVAKIDNIVNAMEVASITLIDLLVAHKNK